MQFKNLKFILSFATYALLTVSSPIDQDSVKDEKVIPIQEIKATEDMKVITENFRVTEYRGDYGLDEMLEAGGFDNDFDLIKYTTKFIGYNDTSVFLKNDKGMACSAFQTPNIEGNGYFFGRNFDWIYCTPLIMVTYPDHGYSSISTVNTDFINWASENIPYEELYEKIVNHPQDINQLPDDILRISAIYTPMDGINEKGLSISVNMVPGNWTIHQRDSGKINLTTLSIVRVMLDKAATVDEALDIIKRTNLHASFDYLNHYLISDTNGKSVTVEYINGEPVVTETKIITNFYIAKELEGVGYGQDRYDAIKNMMTEYPKMNADNVRDALAAAEESTQWSIVYDQLNIEATYYLRGNFKQGYHIKLNVDNALDDETLVGSDPEDSVLNISDNETIIDLDNEDSAVEESVEEITDGNN